MFEDEVPSTICIIIGVLLLAAAFVIGIVAIWGAPSHSDLQSKLMDTVALTAVPGGVLVLGGMLAKFG